MWLQTKRMVLAGVWLATLTWLSGGVAREIQNFYVEKFKNRAMFLKVPVHGFRQVIAVRSGSPQLDRSNLGQPLAFKVGDQIRILDLNFRDDAIRFKISAVDLSRESELVFQFPAPLGSDFSQRPAFEQALDFCLTEGFSYKEIDAAKEDFIALQFDQLIQQFANTTGTSSDFVIRTISEQNPDFRKTREALREKESEVQALQVQLRDEGEKRREALSQLAALRRDLAKAQSDADSLKLELASASDEEGRLQEEMSRLRAGAEQGRQSLNKLSRILRSLGREAAARGDLDHQAEALTEAVAQLQGERQQLSRQLQERDEKVNELEEANRKLASDLRSLSTQRDRLSARLDSLTSDRKSLNARYLELQDQKEIVETAQALRNALRFRSNQRTEGTVSGDVFLLSQRIGTLEIEIPRFPGQAYQMRFAVLSPDTIRFSDEERKLYSALGEEISVEAAWHPGAKNVQATLLSDSALQKVRPRQEAIWSWIFEGSAGSPVPLSLDLELRDAHQQKIPLAQREFVLLPTGAGRLFHQRFPVWTLFASFALGALLMLVVLWRGRRAQRATARPRYLQKGL